MIIIIVKVEIQGGYIIRFMMNNITFPCYCWVDVGNGPALMLLVHVSHITMSNWLFQEYLLPQYMNKFITINLVIHANGLLLGTK